MEDVYCGLYDFWWNNLGGGEFVTFVLAEAYEFDATFGLLESVFQDTSTSAKWRGHLNCAFLPDTTGPIDTTDTSGTIGLMKFETASPLLFPNPSTGLVYLGGNMDRTALIKVYDIYGRRVHAELRAGQIDLAGLPKGIYIVEMYSQRGVEVERLALE